MKGRGKGEEGERKFTKRKGGRKGKDVEDKDPSKLSCLPREIADFREPGEGRERKAKG